MADVTVGTVVPLPGAKIDVGIAGESLVDGNWIYLKSSDRKVYKSSNDVDEDSAETKGMIVGGGGALDDPVSYVFFGPVDMGVTLTKGPYFVSANDGKTCPFADLSAGNYQSQTGHAVSASQFNVNPLNHGVMV